MRTVKLKALAALVLREIYTRHYENGGAIDIYDLSDALCEKYNVSADLIERAGSYLCDKGLAKLFKAVREPPRTFAQKVPLVEYEITAQGIDVIEDEDEKVADLFGTGVSFVHNDNRIQVEIKGGKNNPTNISAPQVHNPQHKNVGEVNYGTKIDTQIVGDQSKKVYTVEKENNALLDMFTKPILEKLGEKFAGYLASGSLLTALAGWSAWYDTQLSNAGGSGWKLIPNLPTGWETPVLWITGIALVIGLTLVSMILYKRQSRCKSCKEFYAYEEVGEPEEEELEVRNGYRIKTIRHYQCRFCGDKTSRTRKTIEEKEKPN